jgi:hypothetical protein
MVTAKPANFVIWPAWKSPFAETTLTAGCPLSFRHQRTPIGFQRRPDEIAHVLAHASNWLERIALDGVGQCLASFR